MTPSEISALLANNALDVARYLLPEGKHRGHEYQVGSLAGEPGQSLSVRVSGANAGVWKDFADNASGGDLLDLWTGARNLSFVDALKEAKEYLGVVDEPYKFKPKKAYKKPEKPKCTTPTEKMYQWFSGRGITKETVVLLKIGEQKGAILFPYLSPEGELELAKYRAMREKKFWSNDNPIPCLFGWQAVSPDAKEVVICEGEIDCLSFWQQGIPSLSVPKGAGGGGKQDWIEYEYLRLERFRDIYISMDADSAGDKAKAEIIERLGRHRCKIVDLGEYGDANEAHTAGENLWNFIDCAETEDPEELRQISDFHHDILKDLNNEHEQAPGINLPWSKTVGKVRLRYGDVSVWGGINSHGKSLALSQVIVGGVSQGEKFCVASMEMPPYDFGSKLYRQAGWYKGMSDADASNLALFTREKVWIFNSFGTAKASKILEVFEYAFRRYGVKNFVIDSLAKCGFGEDDYNGQKGFVDTIVEFALQNKVHVHLVCHMRKQGSEEEIPNKFSIKGTGAISDMVDNVFVVWRNKKKEELTQQGDNSKAAEPDMILDCVKQRKTGVEPRFMFWFDPASCQYLERSGDIPKQYVYWGRGNNSQAAQRSNRQR